MSPCLIALTNRALRLGVQRLIVSGFGRSYAMMTAPSHHMVGKGVGLGCAVISRGLPRPRRHGAHGTPAHLLLRSSLQDGSFPRPSRRSAKTAGHRSFLDDKFYASFQPPRIVGEIWRQI